MTVSLDAPVKSVDFDVVDHKVIFVSPETVAEVATVIQPSVDLDLADHTVVFTPDSTYAEVIIQGPQGPPGPPGVSGGTPREIVPFPVPSTEWIFDLGRPVDVVVVNSAGQVVWPGEFIYGPGTLVTLRFSAPFSGEVHCYT